MVRASLPLLGTLCGLGLVSLLGLDATHETSPRTPAPPPGHNSSLTARPSGTLAAALRRGLPLRPPPTENWLDEDAEKTNKRRRKDWFRQIHRAPPDVDWKAIERANGLAQVEKRNTLAMTGKQGIAPPSGDDAGQWVERGSQNQAGRMHVALHGPDQQTLYAGSSLGGVWKGSFQGEEWTPIGDNLYGGAHWLVVLPGEEEGDLDIVLAATDGGLLHRTQDDGQTWEEPEGIGSPWAIRRLLVTQDGTWTVFVVTQDWHGIQLLRSTDGGSSFEEVYDLGSYGGDVWAPRDGQGPVYLLAFDQLLTSEDLGDTWENVGLVGADSDSGNLVGSEAGAPRLWAVTDSDSLYRSDDAGGTWEFVYPVVDYWGSLNASFHDMDVFAWGGVEVWHTRDGAESFQRVNEWWEYYEDIRTFLHADIPGIDVALDSEGEELWYISTDGGLYVSEDRLESVENLSLDGLRVSQYYSTLTSSRNPDHVAAGAQDQGYQFTNGVEQTGDIWSFDQPISGDYGHLTSSDGTHDYVYSVYPGFILVQVGEDDPEMGWADPPADEVYAWLPPVVADPVDPTSFFFCARKLYRYTLEISGWVPVQWSEESFDDHGDEYVSAIAFSPLDSDRAWLATNYGRLFHSTDHAVNWTMAEDTGPWAHYFYGTALLGSSTNRDLVWAAGSGYGDPSVYRSTDGGVTWDSWSQGLPDTTVYALAEAPDGSGRLFAGTETAAYMRGFEDDSWTDITGNEAPITLYWSAEALAHENTVRFGTYGRGIWDYQFPEGPPLEVDLGDTGDAPTNLGTHDAPGAGGGSLSTCGCTTPSRSDRSSGTWALLTLLAMTRLRRRQPPSGS